jgi:hypothetical protein
MSKGKVLVIRSNATEIEIRRGTGKTGKYLNETVVPIWAIQAAGYDVVLAIPGRFRATPGGRSRTHYRAKSTIGPSRRRKDGSGP